MKNRARLQKGERGQVLIFVTVLLMLAALVLPPVLSMTSAATHLTNVSKAEMQQFYAADTGVEDASYALTADPGFFASLRESEGNPSAPFYDLHDVNGYEVHVEINPGVAGDGVYEIISTAATGFDGLGKPTGQPTVVRSQVAVYQLNIGSGDGGNVTTPGEGNFTYAPGTVVSLGVTTDAGYGFVNWTGDVGAVADASAGSTTITMNGDYTIRANFSGSFRLTVNCTEGGNVTADGGLTVVGPGQGSEVYEAGTVVNLQALEGQSYGFINWTGDVGKLADPNDASTTITMLGNYTIQANFGLKWCTLNTGSTDGGNVTTPGEPGPYQNLKDSVVPLVATPETCYKFVNWTGDVATVDDVNAASTHIHILGNYTVQANFEPLPNHKLNVSHGPGGHVTAPGEGAFTYCEGTVVSLLAVPDVGYGFVDWTGDVATVANPSAASTTITMNGNCTIAANFVAIPYQLTIGHTGPGHVTAPGEGTLSYPPGTVVNLIAVADEGNHFDSWTGDVGTIADVQSETTTITMNDDYAISANFHSGPPYYPGFEYALCSFGGLSVYNNSVITGDMYAGGAVVFGNNAKVKADPSKDIKGNAFGKSSLQFDNNGLVEGNAFSKLGDVKLNNNSQVYGDAYAGGDVILSNNGKLWQDAFAMDDISVGTNGIIYGDATYVDTITVGGGGQVKGQKIKDPNLTLPEFPEVTPPTQAELDQWMAHYEAEAEEGGIHDGAYTIQNNQTLTLGPIHIKGNLVVTNNCTITLGGIVYVDGTISISNNCKVQGEGTLVAEGSITAQNSAMLDLNGMPVVMSLGNIQMKNNSTTQAVLFAPLGTVDLKNNASVFGAVVANGITSNNNFQVTYDPSLKDRHDLPGA